MWPPDPRFTPEQRSVDLGPSHSIRFYFAEPEAGMVVGETITFAAVVQVTKLGTGTYELTIARADEDGDHELS